MIYCFSRYCWLVPIKERSAETIAQALLERVFLGEAMFPVVLRSDNAQEFVGAVMEEINRLLAIRHVTGSSYHPQSQGIVESMHRKFNGLVRALVDEVLECWEAKIPYCQAFLRIIPLKALGGRSPYEVVTGLRPKLPAALDPAIRWNI